ncbi:MAG: hypothetical protein WBE76_21620 [Terracidiphilus sp.]
MKAQNPVLAAVLVLFGASALAESSLVPPPITPVQAELIADLSARLLKVGSTVFARVTANWSGADCSLRNGAILEGRVVSVVPHTKTAKISELDIAFNRAQCGQPKLGAFGLMLAAIAAPQDNDYGIMSDALPIMTSGPGSHGDIQGLRMSQMGGMMMQADTGINEVPKVPHMKMGEVSGIRGLRLGVGTGPENSTILTITGHDVSLEKRTTLLLVPARGTYPRMASAAAESRSPAAYEPSTGTAAGNAPSSSSDLPPPPAETPVDDTIETCAPPECNVALPAANSIDLGKTAATISIRQLGYAPRPQRILDSFENDDALAYLGPKELLVAFNPHILAPRHLLGKSGWTVRVIRAALVNTATHRVTNTADWELPDNGQYLWPLADGRVLVHVGSELRVYGEGLKIEKRIPLEGPLAFVRVTPDGSFMAVGVIHERYSPELHAALRENLGSEPEEDVGIEVLNREFEVIAKSAARSRLMPPTLLDEGQARLLALPNMRYSISMSTWDNHTSTIARFSSSCTPEISSVAPDLLFLVSCSRQTQGREYRVLRSNGTLALRSDSTLNECGDAAQGSANRQDFVVKIVHSSLPVPPGAFFSANNFSFEELGVYRAADGKRLLTAHAGSPTVSRDGYALAPDGSELAVLTRDQIAIYSVPQK